MVNGAGMDAETCSEEGLRLWRGRGCETSDVDRDEEGWGVPGAGGEVGVNGDLTLSLGRVRSEWMNASRGN